jgi:signal transduction histidine kinase
MPGNKDTQKMENLRAGGTQSDVVSSRDEVGGKAETQEIRRMKMLLELSKKMSSNSGLHGLLVDVVDGAIEATGAERGFLMLLENPVKIDPRLFDPVVTRSIESTGKMEFRVARSATKSDLQQENFRISMSIANRVAETGEPIWVRDAQTDKDFQSSKSINSLDLRSILCAALKLEEKILGVLYLDSRFLLRAFTEEDFLLLEALSEHAAGAISKARLYETALQKVRVEEENQELRLLDRKKSDFINMLSHEFRTPLTVVQGYSERLKAGKVGDLEQVKAYARIIHEEAKRLSRMVDDLLDISRIKSGKGKLSFEIVDLCNLIEKSAQVMKQQAESKELKVSLLFVKRPIQIAVDQDKVYQLLMNLIDNAIKYTRKAGTVQVRADEIPTLEVQGEVFISGFAQVSVIDTGLGISPADKERIFDEFYRTVPAVNTGEQGTGLGLSICRGIVQAHGGRIWVESQPGRGSKFIFTLPIYRPIDQLPQHKFQRS